MKCHRLFIIFLALFFCASSFSASFRVVPKKGTVLPTQIVKGNTAYAFYTITNIYYSTLKGFVSLPPNVTQTKFYKHYSNLCGSSFTLAPGASCTLVLLVSGKVNGSIPSQQLSVCILDSSVCEGTLYPLNVELLLPTISGFVHSGHGALSIPIRNAKVIIYKAGSTSAKQIGRGVTNKNGKFYIYIPKNNKFNGVYYAIATKGKVITLISILGTTIPRFVTLNEMTTVAGTYAMAQFLHKNGRIYGNSLGLRIAFYMAENLVSSRTGSLSKIIRSSPNGNETNTMRSIGSLANLITPCVRTSKCLPLFSATRINGIAPSNTLQALVNIAHNPANNVNNIFLLSKVIAIYAPYLKLNAPDAWTLAIKFNNTGDDNYLFGGPANVIFDEKGFVWITNNVVQGTPDSSRFIVVLKPNGQPADGKNNTPISPILGGGLLGTAFGITGDALGNVWIGNFGWGGCDDCNPVKGSVSVFSPQGHPITANGYSKFVYRAQSVVTDPANNIWIASYGNNRIVVYPNTSPEHAFFYQQADNTAPFGMVIAKDGSAWVANSTSSTLNKYKIVGQQLVQLIDLPVGSFLKDISLDSGGNVWVASVGDSTIYQVSPSGVLLRSIEKLGGISGPWGVQVDGDDNVWVANFNPSGEQYSISKICGIQQNKCPAGLKTGDPISPDTGYTLPSGGSQVLLHNGTPLYGENGPPSFSPLMRLTSSRIDKAGNLWAANNWKPSFILDLVNPGGDGMVVFVGLAAPLK